ncbi:MAG: hypothetical protein R6V53_02500 [Candidatus Woesearchaeota archaeon]
MEDSLGVLFSVLALAIAIGGIAQVIHLSEQDKIEKTNARALNELRDQCEYVCHAGPQTTLPVEVSLYPGIIIYAHDYRICMQTEEDMSCEPCPCEVESYSLNLSKTFLREKIGKHSYTCDFTRKKEGISFECQG